MIIKKKEENKLLGRTEVEAEVTFEGATPSRLSLKQDLAKELKADESLVIVQKVETNFGENTINVFANVYKKSEDLEGSTSKFIKERH